MHTIFFAVTALVLLAVSPCLARPDLDINSEAKISALIDRMTLDEKIGQLNLVSRGQPIDDQLASVRKGRIGAMLNVADPRDIRAFKEAAKKSTHGIPLLLGLDAIHAFSMAFPPPLAWAATWNPGLAERAAEAVARDTAAIGINWTFAPMVDISRDPRWGRVIEGAGEDPLLASAFAAARVRGYRTGGLAVAVKHFVGYGAPEAGRDYAGASISLSELHDRYLPPFKAALDAGAESVMAAFNTINGVPVTANRKLLTDLLKRDLGFEGFITSDFAGINELRNHGVAGDLAEAARKAMIAGIDLDMESAAYDAHLADLVRAGSIPIGAVDDAVRRVLRTKQRMGLFEPKTPQPEPDNAAIRAAARNVARESFVLVKNEGNHLPVAPGLSTIAVIGAFAESDYDMSWYGPAGGTKPKTETLLSSMRRHLFPGQRLVYAKGYGDACALTSGDTGKAVETASTADLIVFVAAEDCEISGEGTSRTNLNLSTPQQDLLEALSATGKPIVLVVTTGRPLTLSAAEKHAQAILIAWHPGTEGRTAVAEMLFGHVAPSGKLPMTFPRSTGQIPISYDTLPTSRPPNQNRYTSRYLDEEVTPLYPFGWGLSYTTFSYSRLELDKASMTLDGVIRVSVTVENSGSRAAAEVVQLYIRQLVASRSRPLRQLKGFQKFHLRPGEKKIVHFELAAKDLGFHDDDGRNLIEPGTFQVFAGGSSTADLASSFTLLAK